MYYFRRKPPIFFLLLILLLVGISPPASSQAQQEGTDSLCIHFSGDSKDLLVELKHEVSMSGTLPITICGLRKGIDYDLWVRGKGIEARSARLSVDSNGSIEIQGRRLGTLGRNLIPGWGSIDAGRKIEGWTDIISLLSSGLILYPEEREYRHIENRLTVLKGQLEKCTDAEMLTGIWIEANKASRDLNVQNDHRRRLIGLAAYIYGFQLIDPWLVGNPPSTTTNAEGSIIEIRGSGSRTIKAALLSLFRPGRGQYYQRKEARGILFSLASTAGALVALEYLNQYEEAVNAYELNIEYFNAEDTVERRQYYMQRSSAYWDDVKKTRKWRNISYGVLAGIWAAGVIDAFIPGGEDAPSTNISVEAGLSHAAVVYRF